MNIIDKILNAFTMYRGVLYGLLTIVAYAFGVSSFGMLGFEPLALLGSLTTLVVVSYVVHKAFVKLFHSHPSSESWLITALILFLILKPAETLEGYIFLAVAAALAVASKYILAYRGRHIFNPAGISLLIMGLLGSGVVYWWVGSQVLLPVVLAVGLIAVRKQRSFDGVLTFLVVAMLTYGVANGLLTSPEEIVRNTIVSGPLIFFASIMLIEPQTSPTTRMWRMIYAAVVGVLYGVPFAFGPFYTSPEFALIVGNVLTLWMTSRQRWTMTLKKAIQLPDNIYEFRFQPDRPLRFQPGQYLEWSLTHKWPDQRGTRRFFTIASSPDESEARIAIRVNPAHSSSFKKTLLSLKPGNTLSASRLTGTFTLPSDASQPLVFIAGGIGVTPFRSMVQHMVEQKEKRSIDMFYTGQNVDSFAFNELFSSAEPLGLSTHYLITGKDIPAGWPGKTGFLTDEMIRDAVPNYQQSLFYLSGPEAMIRNYRCTLIKDLKVPRRNIKTDYFSGY